MSTKNFVSYGDSETLFTGVGNKLSSLKSGLTNVETELNGNAKVYPYADVITIPDAVPSNLADCNVKIEPEQDLHGYDKPWVGGAGKNKCDNSTNIVGYYDAAGNYSASYDYKTSALIEVSPNTTYTASLFDTSDNSRKAGLVYTEWDASQNFIQQVANVETITTGATTKYLRLRNYNSQTALVQSNNYAYQIEEGSTATSFAPYENICPITGHTEASVQRVGVNIWDEQWELGDYGTNGEPTPDSSRVRSKSTNYIRVVPSAGYIKVGDGTVNAYLYFYDENKTFLSYITANGAFSIPQNAKYMRFCLQKTYGTTYNNDIIIALGSDAIPYVPYAGRTYTISFGQTVYGEEQNFNTGAGHIVKGFNTFTGANDENWEMITNNRMFIDLSNCYIGDGTWDAQRGKALSNIFDYNTNIYGQDVTGFFIGQGKLNVRVSGITTAEDFKTWLANNPLQLCYELATPTTIQLTPQQIQLLKGTNTLTASTGQISVTVNGVSGAIGSVQEQVNDIAEDVADVQSGLNNKMMISNYPLNLVCLNDISVSFTDGDSITDVSSYIPSGYQLSFVMASPVNTSTISVTGCKIYNNTNVEIKCRTDFTGNADFNIMLFVRKSS